MSQIGFPTLIFIMIVAFLVFGPKKLPELGRSFGNALREFKTSTKGLVDDEEKEDEKKVNEQ